MKEIFAPHLGRTVKIGARKRPQEHQRQGHVQFAKFLRPESLAAVPQSFDWSTLVPSGALKDVLMNDKLGDCTSAGAGHLIDVFTAGGGVPVAITPAMAVAFYSLSTGYVPGDAATDQGGDEVTVLSVGHDKGYDGDGGHAIAGFVQLDPTNADHLRAACYYLGGLYFGLELPDSYVNPMPSGDGFTWADGPPDPSNGHCIVGIGATADGVLVDTWGLKGTLTWAAIADLCSDAKGGMVFAVISKEWVNQMKNQAPSGLDWAAMIAEFDADGGNLPTPSPQPAPPVPSPVPAPAPASQPVTLAQAQAWVTASLQVGPALMTRSQAVTRATQALAQHCTAS